MTRWQEDFLNMSYSVKTVVDKYLSSWTTNAVFVASYNVFISKFSPIEQNRDAQMARTKGVTTDKNMKRKALAEKALFIVNRVQSYATVSSNNELLESVRFTQSDFDKKRDTDIVGVVDMIIAKTNAHISALTTYGVTAAMVTELQGALAAYTNYISKPRIITTQTKNATDNLKQLFKEANEVLTKRLDLDIEVFKYSKPEFYSQYKSARVIISSGSNTTSVLGSVIASNSKEPMKGVSFTFIPEKNAMMKAMGSEASKPIVKKSAEKGKFRASLPENSYTVVIEKIGYQKQEMQISVANGETTKIDVELEKI